MNEFERVRRKILTNVEPLILFESNKKPLSLQQIYKYPANNPGGIYNGTEWLAISSYSTTGSDLKSVVGRANTIINLTDYKELVVEALSTGNNLYPSFEVGFNANFNSSSIDYPYVDIYDRVRQEYIADISSLSGSKYLKVKAGSTGTDNMESLFIFKITLR